jgi:hypothetical protein
MKPKVFKYKLKPRPPKQPLNRIAGQSVDERLSGFVHGQEASTLEERFARALDNRGFRYVFQFRVDTPYQIPGQENEIDFVVEEYGTHPIEVDGNWVHKSAAAKAKDKLRDAILDDELGKQGWHPIVRVPGNDLEDQERANEVVEALF